MWFLEVFAKVQLSKYCLNLKLNFKILINLFNFKTGWVRDHCHGKQADLHTCDHQNNALSHLEKKIVLCISYNPTSGHINEITVVQGIKNYHNISAYKG
jgi:hypothetical protein